MATASDLVVQRILERLPNARRTGFAKALSKLSDSRYFYEAAKAVVPDAYELRHYDSEVVIFEVVDTNPICDEKGDRIAELSDELDDIGWALRVVTLDYMGQVLHELSGWAYMSAYTMAISPPGRKDKTPAAAAVERITLQDQEADRGELYAAMLRIP